MISRPVLIIILGFFMVLAGFVLPFLMVLHEIPSTFFLNFLSFTLSIAGLILGTVGAALYVRLRDK
jgi:hypothetical protein